MLIPTKADSLCNLSFVFFSAIKCRQTSADYIKQKCGYWIVPYDDLELPPKRGKVFTVNVFSKGQTGCGCWKGIKI